MAPFALDIRFSHCSVPIQPLFFRSFKKKRGITLLATLDLLRQTRKFPSPFAIDVKQNPRNRARIDGLRIQLELSDPFLFRLSSRPLLSQFYREIPRNPYPRFFSNRLPNIFTILKRSPTWTFFSNISSEAASMVFGGDGGGGG